MTGVETAEKPGLPPETVGSLQKTAPLVGFNEVTDCLIQTMSWRAPPPQTITGELHVAASLRAFQTSRPVTRSKATTPAAGLPPIETISRLPSTRGEASRE